MKNLRHLLKDSKAAQVAPPITSAGLTAEIVFVPESDTLLPPVFAIGRPKGGGVAARSGLAVMAGITNHVSVAWGGKTARFRVNGLDSSPIPLVADWTPPESLGYAGNRRESVYEFRHGLCAVRIRIAGWNVF